MLQLYVNILILSTYIVVVVVLLVCSYTRHSCSIIVLAVGMYKTPLSNIFLVHDELDKCLGKYSFKNGGSAG